jgi:hypothetical protein
LEVDRKSSKWEEEKVKSRQLWQHHGFEKTYSKIMVNGDSKNFEVWQGNDVVQVRFDGAGVKSDCELLQKGAFTRMPGNLWTKYWLWLGTWKDVTIWKSHYVRSTDCRSFSEIAVK